MLFNSFEFVLVYLPFALAGFYVLGHLGVALAACGWLAFGSLVFYGYWAPEYIVLLLASIAFNFRLGEAILRALQGGRGSRAKFILATAVFANLAVLAYFKYANFFVSNFETLSGLHFDLPKIVLPIGISFFTFTQIAYLVDTYQGKVRETNPIHYLLFVTYFPHLIAGPILHHAEMMPQFREPKNFTFSQSVFLSGLLVFLIGLFKKVVLADGIQPYVGPVFDAPLDQSLTLVEAWGGAIAYTLQLYFDFSGYSDMAIGLSRMFNIELPLNFNSPYKAANISDFWRRWHMTLSRFLRDYLYIPLGGNRSGRFRRYMNLMATMLLGGLWHGAGWTFVVWGALHGAYLGINHAWQALTRPFRLQRLVPRPVRRVAATALTFLCVVVAWVFFRAHDFDSAIRVLGAMFDPSRLVLPEGSVLAGILQGVLPVMSTIPVQTLDAFGGDRQIGWSVCLLVIVWAIPNTQELMARFCLYERVSAQTRRNLASAAVGAIAFWIFLLLMINETRGVSEFIYFNF